MTDTATFDSALSLRQVSKTFGATRALRSVDLDIRRGEVHALVGQNGSGKSTLIKLLDGFHQPDEASIATFQGKKFQLGDRAGAHAAGLRFVHQDLAIVPALDAVDNLALGFGYATGVAGRIKWRQQIRHARDSLAALGYEIDVREPLASLAPVERSAVAIARALQGIEAHSSLLVLDEPTATMPSPEVERLFELVDTLRQRGTSVLYVSHHLDEVYQIADRVTVLRDGQVVTTSQVSGLPRNVLVEQMVGDVRDEPTPDAARDTATDVVLSVHSLAARSLRGIDLDVRAGEILGVAGITGSGREELCDTIFGGRRRAGIVRVRGRAIEAMRPDQMVASGVGLVPARRRDDALAIDMSVRENLTLPDVSAYWRRLRLHRRAERADAQRLMSRLGVVAPSSEADIEVLSGGNQQKVVVGRWLRLEPAVLLLDQPTQGVDVAAKSEIHQLVDEAAAAGTGVLVCSTDEEELERLCHRVLILRAGSIADELTGSEVAAGRIAHATLAGDNLDNPARREATA